MADEKKLTKAEFASKLLNGDFTELVDRVLYGHKEHNLPAASDADPDHPLASNPQLGWRHAETIGPIKGPMTPLPTPREELGNKITQMMKLLLPSDPSQVVPEAPVGVAEEMANVLPSLAERFGGAKKSIVETVPKVTGASEKRLEELLGMLGGHGPETAVVPDTAANVAHAQEIARLPFRPGKGGPGAITSASPLGEQPLTLEQIKDKLREMKLLGN